MGSFANSLFKVMLGWLQAVVSAVWSAFTSENGSSLFNWIGQHWILIAVILCVIGLAADLCVYILRWKPYKVWKNFFTGKGAEEEELQDAKNEAYKAEKTRKQEGKPVFYRDAGESETKKDETDQAPDFSQWETELKETEQESSLQPEQKSVSVTSAGYVVPEDSPYRRPVNKISAERSPETAQGQNDFPENRKSREEPLPIMPRRRKRINVTELFADPEEEIRQFDAPQHVIDSNKAYRDPVYPRGWKKSEDDGE